MSKTLEKRTIAAEEIANTRLEAEADDIFRKYSFDAHRIEKEASKQETEIIFRWGEPHLKQTFEDFMNVFFSPSGSNIFCLTKRPRVMPVIRSKIIDRRV